jgi:hypothetical protein
VSARALRRFLLMLAVPALFVALGHGSVASSAGAKCCTVTYNAKKTHVQVTGIVAYRGRPILFSFHGPCASPAGPGLAYVKSRWIPLRDIAAGYHTINIVQQVNGKIVYTKSPRFFIAGRLRERKPSVTITAGPTGVVTATSAAFEFRAVNASPVLCRLDGGPWAQCKLRVRYDALEPGPHVFTVRGHALAGKGFAEARRSFVLSAPPPVSDP